MSPNAVVAAFVRRRSHQLRTSQIKRACLCAEATKGHAIDTRREWCPLELPMFGDNERFARATHAEMIRSHRRDNRLIGEIALWQSNPRDVTHREACGVVLHRPAKALRFE